MARCCGNGIPTYLIEGDGINVSGSGSATDPYIVGAEGGPVDVEAVIADVLPDMIEEPGSEVGRAIDRRLSLPALLSGAFARRRLGPVRIVFLGSSSSQGFNATSVPMQWTTRVTERLQALYPSPLEGREEPMSITVSLASPTTLPGLQGFRGGILGSDSSDYIPGATLTGIENLDPPIIFHMIGANDYLAGTSAATYQSNVDDAIDTLDTDVGIADPVQHILVHSYRRPDVASPTVPWTAYRDALHAIADARSNVHVIDVSEAFEAADHAGADPLDLIDTDDVHLTDRGHAFLADRVLEALGLPGDPPNKPFLVDSMDGRTTAGGAGSLGAVNFPASSVWTVLTGTWAFTNTGLSLSAGGTIMTADTGRPDVDASALIVDPGTTTQPGLIFRGSDDSNRMGLFINESTHIATLFKNDSAVNTALATGSYAAASSGDYVLRVVARGADIVGYVNGVAVITHTLSGADQTKFGVFGRLGFRSGAAPAALRFRYLGARPV